MKEKANNGLTSAEVEKRIKEGQVNISDSHISKTTSEIIRCHTLTYFNFLNLFLGILVIISGQFKNLTFLGVIICNSVIGIIQELKVKKLIDNLAVITASRVKVCRDGIFKEIPIEEIVIDDLIAVESGNQIGADCEVIEAEGIEVNESMITGESHSVRKQVGDTLWSGSFMVAQYKKSHILQP